MSTSAIYKCKEFKMVNTMTSTQRKKHISQLNKLEKELTKKAIEKFDLNKLIVSPHLKQKMKEQGITFDMKDVKDIVKNFTIEKNLIEVNFNTDLSTRIALKGTKPMKVNVGGEVKECVLCIVINLTNKHLCTLYYNTVEYSKRIPNLSRYDNTLNVVKCLQPYIN